MRKVITVVFFLFILFSVACNANTGSVVSPTPEPTKMTGESYALDILIFKQDMLSSGAKAEGAINMIRSIWSNVIRETRDYKTDPYTRNSKTGKFYDDFNVALGKYFDSEEYTEISALINLNKPKYLVTLKGFRDYPEGYAYVYEALVEYHGAIDDILQLAVEPSGNLQSYGAKVSDAYDRFSKANDDLDAELEVASGK